MKFIKSKLMLLFMIGAFILYFTNDFGLINIDKTAIIVALGVDYTAETEDYDITAQVILPQATDQSTSNSDALITSNAKNIADAIDKIAYKSGWYPKLSFCNVIVLGKGVFDKNVMETLDYFIRSEKISDTALLCATDKEAKELLKCSTPLDAISSFAIQKIVVKEVSKSDKIHMSNVKDFAKNQYSKSNTSLLPLITAEKLKDTPGSTDQGSSITTSTGGQGGGSGGGGSGSQGATDQKGSYVFDATTTYAITNGEKKMELNEYETLFNNLLNKKTYQSYLKLEDVNFKNQKCSILFDMFLNNKIINLSLNTTPTLNISLDFSFKITNASVTLPIEEINSSQKIPKFLLDELKQKIENNYIALFNKQKQNDCDIFNVKNMLYRYNNSKYDKLKNSILQDLQLNLSVKCSMQKT